MGLELYNVGTPKLVYAAYTITYAMMSVIGIGIGIGVTSAIEDNEKAYMTTVGVLSVSYFLELEQHCTNRIFDLSSVLHFVCHSVLLNYFNLNRHLLLEPFYM